MKIDIPYLYRAYGLAKGKRSPGWHDVAAKVEIDIPDGADGKPLRLTKDGAEAIAYHGGEPGDVFGFAHDGRIFLPVTRSYDRYEPRPDRGGVPPVRREDLLRHAAERHGDPRMVREVYLDPLGRRERNDPLEPLRRRERVDSKVNICAPETLKSVTWENRAECEALARRVADETMLVDNVVYTSRYELAFTRDSSGRVRIRALDVVDRQRLLGAFDLEQAVLSLDRPVDPDEYGAVPIEMPSDFVSRLPDADLTALLGLRRCLRTMFTAHERTRIAGSGASYDGTMPERFETAAYRLRLAGTRLREAILAGRSDVGHEARAEIASYIETIRSAPVTEVQWNQATARDRLREIGLPLELFSRLQSGERERPAPRPSADDVDAIEAAGYLP